MRIIGLTAVLIAMQFFGCKTFSNDPEQPDNHIADSYYGIANFFGTDYSVKLSIAEGDSAETLTGNIVYENDTTILNDVYVNSANDTLWFRYSKGSTLYSAFANIGNSSLIVSFNSPSGINSFRLNRRVSGYNLSGIWIGPMSSAQLGGQRDAVMYYLQEGVLFSGNSTVTLLQTTIFEFGSGIFNTRDFQIEGNMRVGSAMFPVLFFGSYQTENQIHGFWHAGQNGEVDNGEFLFVRPF